MNRLNIIKRKDPVSRKPIRYAVVGLGHIAQAAVLPAFNHARANYVLSALVSGDRVKLSKLSSQYRIEHTYTYDQYRQCLQSGFVDAVYIALPNHLHTEYVVSALRAGIHVLCEKPLGLTPKDCKTMIRAATKSRAKLMVAYRLHFDRAHQQLMSLVQSGRLGDVRIIQSLFTQQVRKGDTRLDPKAGGGPLQDIGIYCINAARYLFQAEPLEAFAMALRNRDVRFRGVEEMDGVCLRFPGERLATFVCSFGASNRVDVDIVGTKGNVRLESAYKYSAEMRQITQIGERITTRHYPIHDQFAPQLEYFTDCILSDKEPEPSGLEGLIDAVIIEALLRSGRSRKPVKVKAPSKRVRPSSLEGRWIALPRKQPQVRVKSPTQ